MIVTNTIVKTNSVPMPAPSVKEIDGWPWLSKTAAESVRTNLVKGGYCR